MEIDEIDEAMANLILALDNLRLADLLVNITADEYVNIDDGLVNTQLLTEEEIFEEFLIAEGVLQQMQVHVEENSSDEEEATISVQRGREALELTKKFLEQREFTTESDIRYIRNIIRRLDDSIEKSKRQTLLTEFINQ